jgi:predicted phosphate transport protein (TIGR00153 family)
MLFGGPKSKDHVFFEAFSEHAQKSVEAAKMLVQIFEDPSRAAELAAAINEAESRGDRLTHETVRRLHETWITPLDRNDIHALISRMDDVLDSVEAVSERVVLFELKDARDEAVELARVLVRSCEKLHKAMQLLPNLKQSKELLELCVEVNQLENDADGIYRRAIADLFKPGHDPIMVMKWRDVFDYLESATDRCEDVANVVEGVVLEYA